MLSFDNYTILTDAYTILQKLRNDIYLQFGIDYFRQFIVKESNIQFCCPIHKKGQEQKPSCGISLKDKKAKDGHTIPAGTVHCFTCGYTTTLPEMISNLFGKEDLGLYGHKWLAQNCLFLEADIRNSLELNLDRHSKKKQDKIEYVPESELDRYRFYHDYMYERGLTDELIELYDVGYDCAFQLKQNTKPFSCITFPVRDITGGTLFIARRAINFKLYHYPESIKKPLYGVYELQNCDEIIVCESILNAITATKYGRNAIALLGTGTAEQYYEIGKLPCRKIITAFDGDEAGYLATQKFKKYVNNKLIKSFDMPEGKDVNDLSESQFNNLLEIF